jgi:hypothetical protein
MPDLARPRRDGVLDNVWGVIACLVLAVLIHIPNSGYPASCATRAGATVYLWFCLLPAMTVAMLQLVAAVMPVLRLFIGWFGLNSRLGILPVTVATAILPSFAILFFAPEVLPQAFIAGAVSGLVFTITRDLAGSFTGSGNHPS